MKVNNKDLIKRILKYIQRQNFSYAFAKKNLINYVEEILPIMEEEKNERRK